MSKKEIAWKRISSKILFKSKWFFLLKDKVKLPRGEEVDYFYMEHPGTSVVIPLTSQGEVLMIEQYRYPVKETCLELPAGGLRGEHPEDCARREVEEEIGHRCRNLTLLGTFYPSNSISNEQVYVFLGEDLEVVPAKQEITEGSIRVVKKNLEEILDDISSGKIKDGPTIIALFMAERYLKKRK